MDSSEHTTPALDVIDTVAFKVGLKGYNVDEVDEFLERLSSEARQLKDQLHQQRMQLRQAGERINQLESGRATVVPATAPTPPPAPVVAPQRSAASSSGAEQVTAMIAMAQQFIEHAQQEAEEKAQELTATAQERARQIVSEARSRAEDEVNRLNGLKQRLSEDVDTLTRQLEVERLRLTGALAEFARWIESSLHMGDTARPTPPPPAPTTVVAIVPSPPEPRSNEVDRTPPPPALPRQSSPLGSNQPQTIGQVLNFEVTSRDDRS